MVVVRQASVGAMRDGLQRQSFGEVGHYMENGSILATFRYRRGIATIFFSEERGKFCIEYY